MNNISLNKRNNNSSPLIYRTKFSLMLSYGCTVHKVQCLTLYCEVISFDMQKQRKFKSSEVYVAISRVKANERCSLLDSTITMLLLNMKRYLSNEYKRLKRKENQAIGDSDLLLSDVSLNVCHLNIRSLR